MVQKRLRVVITLSLFIYVNTFVIIWALCIIIARKCHISSMNRLHTIIVSVLKSKIIFYKTTFRGNAFGVEIKRSGENKLIQIVENQK